MKSKQLVHILMSALLGLGIVFASAVGSFALPPDRTMYDAYPPFMANTPPPLVMLVMGRNHKLFYEAYNDASDLNGDGKIDVGYKPDAIDYYGYFDSYKEYRYVSSADRFEPVGKITDKKVTGAGLWSGDFLNYLTMSRMDTIRKVLYGGKRFVDTTTETVLERSYIPQDAHSWGKEYTSVTVDGYDIRDYSPLDLPATYPTQTRHLFANTSLYDATDSRSEPLLRILNDSVYRVWEWVSIERPVAGDRCLHGSLGPHCANAVGGSWTIVPGSNIMGISNVTQYFFDWSGFSGTLTHPLDHGSYDAFIGTVLGGGAVTDPTLINLDGSRTVATVDGSGNPFGNNDYFMSISLGTLNIAADGDYTFAADGDDAVELLIDLNGDADFDDLGEVIVGWYGGHGGCGGSSTCLDSHSATITLAAGSYAFQFRQEERDGDDGYYFYWKTGVPSAIDDKVVRVVVADPLMPEENNKAYTDSSGNTNLKPVGLLQRHGETKNMYFGLLTGSYTLNMSGGVLRKNIGPIDDEIDPQTGIFTTPLTGTPGIIGTIDRFRISEFRYPSGSPSGNYQYDGGWETQKFMTEGQFPDWGNPTAEMMYETLRYFAGETPTADFDNGTMAQDAALGLGVAAWSDPYTTYPECAKPFMLVLSDINPTFDSDQLPGSPFGSFSGGLGTLDVQARASTISSTDHISGNYYLGDQGGVSDSACTPKYVSGISDIRGLCPEEPTKQGSYYSASVAYYGRTEDISATATEDQNVQSYMVGLASPLPRIEIPIGSSTVTLVPFAKSVGGFGINPALGAFQPTNTIVDFYVETIDADNPTYGKFRINYEDVEQGADHDMDAIVAYTYQVYDTDGNKAVTAADGSNNGAYVTITLDSTYAAGGIVQHMGYIISGTTTDGTYLEVRDEDTDPGTDIDYYRDTPNTADDLPLHAERTFFPGASTAAQLLENPLWFAAKWGGFSDKNDNDLPDLQEEWDKDLDGVPDNYYYVVNPLKLEEQLNRSFADILAKTSSGTAAAVVANNSEGQGTMIQAFFKPQFFPPNEDDSIKFIGYLKSLWVDQFGHLREDSNQDYQYNYDSDRIIEYGTTDEGDVFVRRYTQHYHYAGDNQYDADCVISSCTTSYETIGIDDIETLFTAGEILHTTDPANRKIFTFLDGDGLDNNGANGVDESGEDEGGKIVGQVLAPFSDAYDDGNGELVAFNVGAATARIKPFLGLKNDTNFDYLETGGPDHDTRVENLINYIRGVDSAGLVGNPGTRNRTFDGNVWKLGDIVRSTPVSVAGAVENYAVLYSDESYLEYIRQYKNRETVVYAGANDGMLHAFTHGEYRFDTSTGVYGYHAVGSPATPIGTELWAFIPQTLLPHLKWLADPDYGHAFYVDLKPKVFDARVFPDDADHPQGWGTLLLVGLGAGGKHVWAEGDFDQSGVTPDVTRHFYPTYVCMDITNPRNPRLLWERSYPNLGMSASFPAVIQAGAEYNMNTHSWSGGQWRLVFGSGPNDSNGKQDYYGYSDQNGYIFAVDVRTGALLERFDTGASNTVMASPVSLDKASNDGSGPVDGLTYNVDAIYIGSSGYDGVDFSGKLFKLNTRVGAIPQADPTLWDMSVLFDSDRPITAAPAVSVDILDNVWVMFGTGRFQEMSDRTTTHQNYLYGLKDPYFNSQYDQTDDLGNSNPQYNGRGDFYHDNSQSLTLTRSDLFYSNPYEAYDTVGTIAPQSGAQRTDIASWDSLLQVVRNTDTDSDYYDGWYRELDPPAMVGDASERIISKPAILSGILFTPVYIPDSDLCGFGGSADTYGVYFESGTPNFRHIFYSTTNAPNTVVSYRGEKMLNAGPPPPTVSVHIGRESGAKLFTQTGTGPVLETSVSIDDIKSDIEFWGELDTWTDLDPNATSTFNSGP
jgi:type IV pilus assembly protein PilY1